MINRDEPVSFALVLQHQVIFLEILGVVCVALLNLSFSVPAISLFFGLARRL